MRLSITLLLLLSIFLPAVHAQTVERTLIDRPDDEGGYQVQVVYVIPSDGVDRELDINGAIATSFTSVIQWMAKTTGGRTLRVDTYNGALDIPFVRLSQTEATLASQGLYIRDAIEAEMLLMGFNNPKKLYAVYYDGEADGACGGAAWPPEIIGRVGAIYLKGRYADPNVPTCDTLSLASSIENPDYFEFAILHELFHSLGAVPTCAPNHHLRGHSADNPKDLMYSGEEVWRYSALDIGADDYYGHSNPDCYDLEDSVFMTPTVENPVLPPGWGTDSTPPIFSTVETEFCPPVNEALTTVLFLNLSSQAVDIYWVNYDCQEQYYTTLQPGITYRQGSYVGHAWRVRDANGGLMVETIAAGALPYTVPITD